jgi:hypothetical protein
MYLIDPTTGTNPGDPLEEWIDEGVEGMECGGRLGSKY